MNECTLNLDDCHDQANCTNNPGSFSCACNNGWTGNGTVCQGTPTELTVNFKHIFYLMKFCLICERDCHINGNSSTSDVDECMLNVDDCDDQAMCNNAPGSFSCSCNIGWTGNGTSCEGTAKELTVGTFFLLNFSCKIDCHISGNVLLQMWMNAHLIFMTVMTRQCATTLQVHFHALVTTLGPEMELVVRVCEQNGRSTTIFPPKFVS